MHEFSDPANVPQHEVERRLREVFARELESGERGVVQELESKIHWMASHWAQIGQVFKDLEALFGDGGGPAPLAG